MQERSISEEFAEIIIALVDCAVKSICSSVQYRGDSMDLNNYIRFQLINCNDRAFTGFFPGFAFQKNLASRKMEGSVQNPRILMVRAVGEIQGSGFISMDKLIQLEGSLNSMILKKISSCGANVLVCKNSLTQPLINELADSGITAIVNVKLKYLHLLARAVDGKVINSCDEIPYEKNFIGECGSFIMENRGGTKIVHFTGLKDRSTVGTIFISGPDKVELCNTKNILKSLILEYRNIRLENCLFNLFALHADDNIFTKFMTKSVEFKHFILSEFSMCVKPETIKVDMYSAKDMTLGEYFYTVHEKIDQKCPKCESSWGNHKLYYLQGNGRIRIRFYKSTSKEGGIFLNRECQICGKFEKNITRVPESVWEYSFYKFLNNFFTDATVYSSGISCRHNFFKLSQLIFFIKDIKIAIQWEENPTYTILNMNDKPDVSDLYTSLLQRTVEETKKNASKVMEDLIQSSKELLISIDNDITEEMKKTKSEFWLIINTQVSGIMDKISLALVKVYEINLDKFSNYIQALSQRRRIFLKICSFKRTLTSIKRSIKDEVAEITVLSYVASEFAEERRHRKLSNDDDLKTPKRSMTTVLKRTRVHSPKIPLKMPLGEFTAMRQGNPTLSAGRNKMFIPVEEDDPLSIIAYALNSKEYYEQVTSTMIGNENVKVLEAELHNSNEEHFQVNFSTYCEEELKELLRENPSKEEALGLYGDLITFNVHIFYPRQFQIIRDKTIGSELNFLLGISQSEPTKERLGKSKAYFIKSHDNLYIIKILEEKEFNMFKELAPHYFKHFCKAALSEMPSSMVRTLGCYRIYVKNHTKGTSRSEWALLFENLSCNMSKDVEVYDLKGTFNDRRYVWKDEKKTKMDKNFLEDYQGIPLKITKDSKKFLEISLWNDSLFLGKQNIVDYSLLVIICRKTKTIVCGIIDYVVKYTFEKAVEHKYKTVVGTDVPTITRPEEYKQRFRDTICNRIFMEFDEK